MSPKSWVSSKTIKAQPSRIHGLGFFATQPIAKGEIIAVKAGHIVDGKALGTYSGVNQGSELQISDDLFITPISVEEVSDSMIYMNHSCEANAGFGGNIIVVAIRDIQGGEELTLEYVLHHTDPNYVLRCNCQTPSCRKIVTGNDWQKPELQKKYKGYFSWYVQSKIDKYNTEQLASHNSLD